MFSSKKSMVPIVKTQTEKAVMVSIEKNAGKSPELKKAETKKFETKEKPTQKPLPKP